MADSTTPNYLLVEPEVGASADSWGGKINNNLVKLDTILGAITTAGSANAYTLTSGLSLSAYVSGQAFTIKASFSNTGAATLNVDGLGAKSLVKAVSTAVASGDIVSGKIYRVAYDGTNFQVQGSFPGDFQTSDATLTALAALSITSDTYIRGTGTDAFAVDSLSTVWDKLLTASSTKSPQFSTVELGASSDTTLSRASAGRVAVEGSNVVMASDAADQTAMEAASSTTTFASPGRIQYHPGVAKAWVNFNGGGTVAIRTSLNVSSITDNGTGDYTDNFTTSFSSADYVGSALAGTSGSGAGIIVSIAASNIRVGHWTASTGVFLDSAQVHHVYYGDQ
jgi:hypothetical protein